MDSDTVRNLFMDYLQIEEDHKCIPWEEFEKIVQFLKDDEEFISEAKNYASSSKNELEDARAFFRYMINFARNKAYIERTHGN